MSGFAGRATHATIARQAMTAAALFFTSCLGLITVAAQSSERTNWDGVYTTAQAERGAAIYAQQCARCHGPTLAGGDGPPLTGVEFSSNWNDLTLADLSDRIRTAMPPDSPGRLSAQERADLLAHLLRSSSFPAGDRDLSRDAQEQRLVRFKATKP